MSLRSRALSVSYEKSLTSHLRDGVRIEVETKALSIGEKKSLTLHLSIALLSNIKVLLTILYNIFYVAATYGTTLEL